MNSIKSLQKSCFLVFQYLNSITSFAGDGGSDFLFSQILASSEQISFSLVFFRMHVSSSRHIYNFGIYNSGSRSESGNTLLLYN